MFFEIVRTSAVIRPMYTLVYISHMQCCTNNVRLPPRFLYPYSLRSFFYEKPVAIGWI